MHPAQREFIERVKLKFPEKFLGVDVLDVGSLDINGNNRYHFDLKSYMGLDLGKGKNVDLVYDGKELPFQDAVYDVVISTECFEHNAHLHITIKEMVRVLKPGGLMIFSCAGVDRPEHGTAEKDPVASPFTNHFYQNVELMELMTFLVPNKVERIFFPFSFEYGGAYDLYFYGIKRI